MFLVADFQVGPEIELMKSPGWLHWLLLAGIAALSFILCASPYESHHHGLGLIGVNRITGTTERLTRDGWKAMTDRFVLEQLKRFAASFYV